MIKPEMPRWFRVAYWICFAIANAAVIRRLLVLATSPNPSNDLDAAFASEPALTSVHILLSMAFVATTAVVLFRTGGYNGL